MAKKQSKFLGLEELKIERNRLMLDKSNPERLAEIIKIIDYIEYGIQ